mgnify:CR=1 FL=1
MALSTTRTLLTQTGINTTQVLDVGGLSSSGIATFSNFKTGTTDVHSVGVNAATMVVGSAVTSNSDGIEVTGIVTATSFVGSGSGLTGVASTDHIKTSTVANFTGGIQVGGATTLTSTVVGAAVSINSDGIKVTGLSTFTGGVKVPDSTNSSGATNYIHVGNSADLQIYHNGTDSRIDNRTGGLQIRSDGGLNLEGATSGGNADFLKAYSTGDRRVELYNSDAVKLTTTSGGVEISGVATAVGGNPNEGSFISGTAVGVGTTTTTGRNAGVGTAPGTLIFNSTSGILQVYVADSDGWQDVATAEGYAFQATGGTKNTSSRSGYAVHTFTGPGTFTVTGKPQSGGEVLIVGGGGGGGRGGVGGTGFEVGAGGAGGHRSFSGQTFTPGSYPVVVGAGGPGGGTGDGGTSSVFGNTSAGGGGGAGNTYGTNAGRSGGSGGGGAHSHTSGGSGNTPPTSPPQGNNGGQGGQSTGGGGGGAGGGGTSGKSSPNNRPGGGEGGSGASNSITGSSVTRAGGGGGGHHVGPNPSGGSGGGGAGGRTGNTPNANGPQSSGDPGTANTGSGGGGSGFNAVDGGNGGSGIVIIAYPTS